MIGQGRVKALAIIDLLDEAADHLSGMISIAVGAPVHLLLLERFHEALCLGIVIRVTDAAHAGLNIMRLQQGAVIAAGILHAAIGVMDKTAGRRPARGRRHSERGDG